jgi:competence protein ComGC
MPFLSPSHWIGKAVSYLVVIVFLALLWSMTTPAITVDLEKTPRTHALSCVKQLSLALQQYASDQQTQNQAPPFFPDKLTDLVKDGYVSQSDYSKLTKDIEICYFQPNTVSPSSNHLLLVAHIPKYVFYARVDGKLELKKIP